MSSGTAEGLALAAGAGAWLELEPPHPVDAPSIVSRTSSLRHVITHPPSRGSQSVVDVSPWFSKTCLVSGTGSGETSHDRASHPLGRFKAPTEACLEPPDV